MKECCKKIAKEIFKRFDKSQEIAIDEKADKEGDVFILTTKEFKELKKEFIK